MTSRVFASLSYIRLIAAGIPVMSWSGFVGFIKADTGMQRMVDPVIPKVGPGLKIASMSNSSLR